jgi:hypothetical protein
VASRNKVRDFELWILRSEGMSFGKLSKRFNISSQRAQQVYRLRCERVLNQGLFIDILSQRCRNVLAKAGNLHSPENQITADWVVTTFRRGDLDDLPGMGAKTKKELLAWLSSQGKRVRPGHGLAFQPGQVWRAAKTHFPNGRRVSWRVDEDYTIVSVDAAVVLVGAGLQIRILDDDLMQGFVWNRRT